MGAIFFRLDLQDKVVTKNVAGEDVSILSFLLDLDTSCGSRLGLSGQNDAQDIFLLE